MTIQLYVDFNSIQSEGRLTTLLQFAVEPYQVLPGAMLIVGDEEGNRAKAHVLEVEPNGRVHLEIQGGTFEAAPLDRSA